MSDEPSTREAEEGEEEEEEDLFVFNDTIEGPRAPVVKPGRITQAGGKRREREKEKKNNPCTLPTRDKEKKKKEEKTQA